MRVLLVAIGSHGDVLPFLALAAELDRRGHAVTLAAPAPFATMADRAGLAFHALGTCADYARFAAEPELWHPRRGVKAAFRYVSALTEPTFAWLAENWRPGEGIVVASTLGLGARVAQDKFGLPLVTVHVMPILVESRHAPPVLPGFPLPSFLPARFRHWLGRGADTYVIGPAVLPELNAFRARLGLPPVRRLRHWWNSPLRVLLTFADWFVPPQPDWPVQAVQVGFPLADRFGDADDLSPALEAFLEAGEPPLAFTYGSAMRQGRSFFHTAVRTCRRMGRRGVLLAPQEDQVPAELPPDVLHVRYAPFSRLLPRCASLVHHGGIGTVAQGLAAGIPQLVVPVAFDHFDEAQRLKSLGVGTALSRRRFTPRRASAEIRRMLAAPQVAQACATARQRMAGGDGVPAACDVMERLHPA
ncbi:glycosyltransferase [Methylobacterium durans]|uniref:glycosyltransferase n=1 Tax=Methylobacterium durans TaxID=2202825 RepID=UPI002AFF0121|nr:nucleotide disphospho-sugar-binding domain-containing protein [Methylobacterium durans]MEA1831578.1 glycosyltransferase [Methylobacterium durans]